MMAPYVSIDESRPPVVNVRVINVPDDENYPAYLDELTKVFRQYDRFGFIFDTGELTGFPSKYRDMVEPTLLSVQGRGYASAGLGVCAL